MDIERRYPCNVGHMLRVVLQPAQKRSGQIHIHPQSCQLTKVSYIIGEIPNLKFDTVGVRLPKLSAENLI